MSSFSFGKVKVTGDSATIPLTVTFTDKTSAPGTMVLAKKGGKWYLESVAGERKRNDEGLADTVAADTDEDSPEHLAATRRRSRRRGRAEHDARAAGRQPGGHLGDRRRDVHRASRATSVTQGPGTAIDRHHAHRDRRKPR